MTTIHYLCLFFFLEEVRSSSLVTFQFKNVNVMKVYFPKQVERRFKQALTDFQRNRVVMCSSPGLGLGIFNFFWNFLTCWKICHNLINKKII